MAVKARAAARELIRERVRSGIQQARRNGKQIGLRSVVIELVRFFAGPPYACASRTAVVALSNSLKFIA
jgi:hypothetical protein